MSTSPAASAALRRTAASAVRVKTPLYAPLNGRIHRYNVKIGECAEVGNLQQALMIAKELRTKLAHSSMRPDLHTYQALTQNFAVHGMAAETLRLVDDARASGLEPDINMWNEVLKAHVYADLPLQPVLDRMADANVEQNPLTKQLVIRRHIQHRDLESALAMLSEQAQLNESSDKATRRGKGNLLHGAPLETVTAVIVLATAFGESRLATDLIRSYQDIATRQLPEYVYLGLAAAAVNENDVESAEFATEYLQDVKVMPDEGLAVSLLNLFSRHGKVDRCESLVNTTMPKILKGFPLREWHLAPLVTVYTAAGRLRDAMSTFSDIRALNVKHSDTRRHQIPTAPSYTAFLDGLTTSHQAAATFSALVDWLEAETPTAKIPTELANAVMKACVQHGMLAELHDLETRIFDSIAKGSRRAIQPDITTFNILLSANLPLETSNPPGAHVASITSEQIEHSQRLMGVLKGTFAHLQPTKTTYANLAETYVRGPEETWELAFDYLEEMKHFDIAPPAKLYLSILNRLVTPPAGTAEEDVYLQSKAEDLRITLILQEMAVLGYLGRLPGRDGGRSILSRDMRNLIGEDRIAHVLQNLYKGNKTWLDSRTSAQRRSAEQRDKRSRR